MAMGLSQLVRNSKVFALSTFEEPMPTLDWNDVTFNCHFINGYNGYVKLMREVSVKAALTWYTRPCQGL